MSTHNLCLSQKYEKKKKNQNFYLKMFNFFFNFFFVVKFSVYLNRHVFVMSPLILLQLQFTNICLVRTRYLYLIRETSYHSETYKITSTAMKQSKGLNGDLETDITKTRLFKYIENFISKNWKFSDKKLRYFSCFCTKHRLWYSLEPPRWGGSSEYPQSMFWAEIWKNNVYTCKPQFYYIKVGFIGVKII